MIIFIYSVVIFIATMLGAFVGLGGGVVIKPVLDLINIHSLAEISFISSCAVFAMSVTSTAKHIKSKTEIKQKIVLLVAAGSITGGLLGNYIFNFALKNGNESAVKAVQSFLLFAFLLFVVLYQMFGKKTFKIENPVIILLSGLLLGTTAAFLGIGGGPINVAFLTLLFSFTIRDAAVYSVAIIFFSQAANLIKIFINNRFEPFDKKIIPFVIAAAIFGGLVGTVCNRKFNEKTIKTVFVFMVSAVALLSLYNGIGELL